MVDLSIVKRVYVYQRVNHHVPIVFLWFSYGFAIDQVTVTSRSASVLADWWLGTSIGMESTCLRSSDDPMVKYQLYTYPTINS